MYDNDNKNLQIVFYHNMKIKLTGIVGFDKFSNKWTIDDLFILITCKQMKLIWIQRAALAEK